ncbi:MAG TPA: hypothetical protein VLJ79_15820 [Candidatus Binatia bacterium]|nr:hypothetical protein [Candidatus Binatia bacterium]
MAEKTRMYIGTDSGLTVLINEGAGWHPYQDVLGGKFVRAMTSVAGANSVYACIMKEGLFASRDGGNGWELVFSGNVHSVAVDPNDPQVVYAGTEPVGLFRSRDSGRSWSELSALKNQPEAVTDKWWFPRPPHEGHVLSIFVDWHDPRVLCIGLEHGGILRSVDGGENWEDLSGGIEYLDIHTVKGDPNDANLYYTATARGFYRSDQYGRNWIFSQAGIDRSYFHDLVVIPGKPATLLLTTANGTPPAWMRKEKAQSAIFRSLDQGRSWHQLTGGLPQSMERMIWNLSADPNNPDHLYAGAGEAQDQRNESVATHGAVWFSTNRGDNWQQIYEGPNTVRSVCAGFR